MAHPIEKYWQLYGGWAALIRSPYLLAAIFVTTILYPLWDAPTISIWPEISISALPSLMGFSVAGLTVLLAFSDSRSLRAITQRGKDNSYFVKTVANLFHFLIVQTVALVLAIFGKAFDAMPAPFPAYEFSFLGLLSLIYAIFVSIAAAGQLLNTALIINKAVGTSGDDPSV